MAAVDEDEPLPDGAVQTVDEVNAANSQFYSDSIAEGFDAAREAASLRSLLDGSSRARAECACAAIGREEHLGALRARWEPWSKADEGALGQTIQKVVVDDLDAPHLSPSGIEARLLGGLDAACHGLFMLVNSLPASGPAAEAKS